MKNFKPTLDDPVNDQSKAFEKDFKKTIMTTAPEAAPALNEVDGLLTEKEQSLKKKIWSLAKMESLVFSDPKLSVVYEEMAENGEEKYGYHYNETIQNMIFNDYVLNSPQYLQKYKMAIPKEKKRRDKSGINQLKKAGEKKMDATGTKLVTPKEESVEESTSAGSAAGSNTYTGYAGPSAWAAKGDLTGDFKGKKKATDPKAKPISTGFSLKETNYLTDPSGFAKYVDKINEEISLEEKAKSKSQQQFMGMVNAYKNGKMSASDASPEIERAADSMSDKEVDDFASTKHKGLPDHVKENNIKEIKITENMEQFIVTVKHDNGTTKIKTSGSSEDEAKQKVMKAENCPVSAIVNVEKNGIKEDSQSILQGDGMSMSNNMDPTGDQGSNMDMGMQSGGMNEDLALLKEIDNELNAFQTHHNKLKLMAEEKKTPSMIQGDRQREQNPKLFKKDLQHSGTKDIIDVEKELQWKDQQTDVPKDPQKLGQDIEKQSIKTANMEGDEALKNVGDSANDKGDEIPKRNLTTKEQDEVNLYRNGQHSLTYDNDPGERFVERMKADQGQFFEMGEKQKEFKANAPMYDKDTQPVDDGEKKVQFDKNVKGKGKGVAWNERMGLGSNIKLSESMITGRFINALNKRALLEFNMNEVAELSEGAEDLFELDFTGLGNKYQSRTINKKVVVNEAVASALGGHKFYTDGKQVFAMKNPVQKLNEGEVKPKRVISEQEKKMKHLLGYKPQNYIDTKNINL